MRRARTLTFIFVAIIAALPVAIAIAASPKKGGIYVGKSEPFTHPLLEAPVRSDVTIYVSKTGKKVVAPTNITLLLPCPDGDLARGSPEPRNVPIKNGKFSFKGKEGNDDVTMSGTFKKGGRVTGKASYSRAYPQGGACTNELTYTAKLTKKKPPPSGGR
jgi:hypothetical protein